MPLLPHAVRAFDWFNLVPVGVREAHGYEGWKTLLHILAERINWFDKYVKNAPPRVNRQTAAN